MVEAAVEDHVEESTPLMGQHSVLKRGSRLATLKVVCMGGAGILADGYDLSVINLTLAIIAHLYPTVTAGSKGFIVCITIIGVIVGQVTFGTIADIIGRRCASLTTASLTIAGAALSACVTNTHAWGLPLQLALCRLILGLGVGGEYPLSAAISKEVGSDSLCLTRAQLLVINMMMFNIGSLLQSVLVLVLLGAQVRLEVVWRVAFAFGIVPSTIALILRLQMHEPAENRSASSDLPSPDGGATAGGSRCRGFLHDFAEAVGPRWHILLGACLSWGVFNFVAYGQGSFSSIICDRMLGRADDTTHSMVMRDGLFALIMSVFSIAGSLLGLCVETLMSRRHLQALGFTGIALSNWICGSLLDPLPDSWSWLLMVFYCGGACASSIIGITTYLVPAENFPAAVRATCVGLAAASGKMGAAIGTGIFPITEHRFGLKWVLLVCGFVMLLGNAITLMLTPGSATAKDV